MSVATQYYVATLLIYVGVDIIAAWGLNLQYGVAGVLNFGFIAFQAVGAYIAAVLTLGASSPSGYQEYIAGARLPFPVPLLAAGAAGAVLALVVGLVGLRRLRRDYQAMVLLVVALTLHDIVTSDASLFNGPSGLALVPKPLASAFHLSGYEVAYNWIFVGIVAVVAALVYFVVDRITGSPLGRTLRAMRENEDAVAALGRNTAALRLFVFAVGGAIAAVSGALLVEYISAWSPASWLFPETFSFLAAVIIGGSGNNLGVAVGAVLIPVGSLEAVRFIPSLGSARLAGSLQWIAAGVILLIFLWFWPRGLIPERRRRYPREMAPGTSSTVSATASGSAAER